MRPYYEWILLAQRWDPAYINRKLTPEQVEKERQYEKQKEIWRQQCMEAQTAK